jgi:hypothetical protein
MNGTACPCSSSSRRDSLRRVLDGVLKARHCAKAYGCDQPEYCSYRATDTCPWVAMLRRADVAG